MSQPIQVSFIGSGVIYYKGRDIGNCSAADITYDVDKQTLPNYRGGGGNADVYERISAVNLALGITSLNAANLALLNNASVTTLTGQDVTDEAITVSELDRLLRVDHMIDTAQAVTVKDALDAAVPALHSVNGTPNYTVTSAGIIVPTGSEIEALDEIKVTYKVPAGYLLQALLTFGEEGDVVIDGLNDINGKRHVIDCWRWKPRPPGIS
ncbi:hypothetical protein ORI99_01855, partial [Alishewanella sp. SMS9]|nr:hypothetical protein [Alishewanella sp. SMS9]